MTFTNVTPRVFAGLKKQLADSHEAVMTTTTARDGEESGTIVHDRIQAKYTYAANILTVNVTIGGNIIVNHVIHSRIQEAIAALQQAARPAAT
jgi:hypothetical protein